MVRRIAAAIALALIAGITHASLLVNGGFESGLTGWTCTAPGGQCFTGNQGPPAIEGLAYFYGFANSGTGELSQDFATDVGVTYSVSLVFNTNGSVPPNSLAIEVGDLSATLALQQGTWNAYSASFTALSTTTSLDFLFRTVGGSGTVWIDNVVVDRVGAVPLPSTAMLLAAGLLAFAGMRRART